MTRARCCSMLRPRSHWAAIVLRSAAVRAQPAVFGSVASDPTVYLFAAWPQTLTRVRSARSGAGTGRGVGASSAAGRHAGRRSVGRSSRHRRHLGDATRRRRTPSRPTSGGSLRRCARLSTTASTAPGRPSRSTCDRERLTVQHRGPHPSSRPPRHCRMRAGPGLVRADTGASSKAFLWPSPTPGWSTPSGSPPRDGQGRDRGDPQQAGGPRSTVTARAATAPGRRARAGCRPDPSDLPLTDPELAADHAGHRRRERPTPRHLRLTDHNGWRIPVSRPTPHAGRLAAGRPRGRTATRPRRTGSAPEGHRAAEPALPRLRPEPALGRSRRLAADLLPGPKPGFASRTRPPMGTKRLRLRILAVAGRIIHTGDETPRLPRGWPWNTSSTPAGPPPHHLNLHHHPTTRTRRTGENSAGHQRAQTRITLHAANVTPSRRAHERSRLVPMDVVSTAAEGEAGGVSVPESTLDVRGRPVVLAAGGREGDDAEPRIRWLGGVGLWAAGAVVASGVVAAASFWTVMESVGTSHDPLWVSPVTVTRDANDDRPSESPSDDASHDADDSGPRSNDDASDVSSPVTTDDSRDNSGPGSGDGRGVTTPAAAPAMIQPTTRGLGRAMARMTTRVRAVARVTTRVRAVARVTTRVRAVARVTTRVRAEARATTRVRAEARVTARVTLGWHTPVHGSGQGSS